jgi:hypothetical protein
VATRRWDAAPNPEWVLMYRRGLSGGQIADLESAAPATVGYHLNIARAADPELLTEHQAAAGVRTALVTSQGQDRMQQLVTMVQETGRYPSRNAPEVSERTLAAWLQRRRREAGAESLAPPFRDVLAVLPGWESEPRAIAEEARRQDCLGALAANRAAGRDWPRHKATVSGEEHELGSGCTPSVTSCAAANSIRRRRRRWTPQCPGGGPADNAAGNPRPCPESSPDARR